MQSNLKEHHVFAESHDCFRILQFNCVVQNTILLKESAIGFTVEYLTEVIDLEYNYSYKVNKFHVIEGKHT